MRQIYTAGFLAIGGSSTDLGGSNDSAIIRQVPDTQKEI
jgi:hypothetical protein